MTEMGTHEAGHAALSREGSPRRRWLIVASTAVVLVTVAVRIGFASKSSDSGSIDGETVDSTASPAAVSPSLSVPPERRYSDLELGLDAVIEEEIMPFYARYRSFADWEEPYEERQRYLDEEAVVKAICKGAVEYVVDKGVNAAAKKVGGWARKSFPAAVLKVAQRLSLVLGLAQDLGNVVYQALASDVACD